MGLMRSFLLLYTTLFAYECMFNITHYSKCYARARLVIEHGDHGDAPLDPVPRLEAGWHFDKHDKVCRVSRRGELSMPRGGSVDRAFVSLKLGQVLDESRFEPDDGRPAEEHLWQ